jgi:hypothetical protein
MPQFPFVQDGLPLTDEHILPQAPQLLTSLVVLISQPLLGLPLQLANGKGQNRPQVPKLQTGELFWPEGQVCPQPPQLLGLVRTLTSQPLLGLPSQSTNVGEHVKPQIPDEQVGELFRPKGHTLSQPPQLFTSKERFAQFPGHRVLGAGHEMPQVPSWQNGVPFAGEVHIRPQNPQLFTSVRRLTQFPEQEKFPGRHDAIIVSTT